MLILVISITSFGSNYCPTSLLKLVFINLIYKMQVFFFFLINLGNFNKNTVPGSSAELLEAGEGMDRFASFLLLPVYPELLQCS